MWQCDFPACAKQCSWVTGWGVYPGFLWVLCCLYPAVAQASLFTSLALSRHCVEASCERTHQTVWIGRGLHFAGPNWLPESHLTVTNLTIHIDVSPKVLNQKQYVIAAGLFITPPTTELLKSLFCHTNRYNRSSHCSKWQIYTNALVLVLLIILMYHYSNE